MTNVPLLAPRKVMPLADFAARASPVDELINRVKQDDLSALKSAIGRVLASDDGKVMLEHLLDISLRAQGINPFSEHFGGTAEKVAMAASYRAGQNSLVQHLLSLAAQAEGQPGFSMKPPI